MGTQSPQRLYTYTALEKGDWIQVLQLLVRQPAGDHIECSLQTIKHTDRGYQAHSYVWGNPEKPFKVFVVDYSRATVGFSLLTINLHNAMHNLRDCEEAASQVFKIDQICINQESNDEKNHEVAMMA